MHRDSDLVQVENLDGAKNRPFQHQTLSFMDNIVKYLQTTKT